MNRRTTCRTCVEVIVWTASRGRPQFATEDFLTRLRELYSE